MPTTPVQGSRLREIRNNRNTTQEELAEQSKVSVKTIKNIERTGSGTHSLRRDLAEKLADALKLGPSEKALGILEGAEPFAPHPQPASDEVEYEINCELMRMRYGVDKEWLQHYSPLMFAVLAEQFLEHQREKLAEMAEALSSTLDTSVSVSLDDFRSLIDIRRRAMKEAEALDTKDVMRPTDPPQWLRFDHDEHDESEDVTQRHSVPAILWYLRSLGSSTEREVDWHFHMGNDPDENFWNADFRVYSDGAYGQVALDVIASVTALNELVGGDPFSGEDPEAIHAALALACGLVGPTAIPDYLTGPENSRERKKWLGDAYVEHRRERYSGVTF